jgi:hypothetical protein
MHNIDGLTFAQSPLNIPAVIEAGLLQQYPFVLMTCIDSHADVAGIGIRQRFFGHDPDCSIIGDGVLTNGRALSQVATELFTGFDELWCFERQPNLPHPKGMSIVSPLDLDVDIARMSPTLSQWMAHTDCKLGLGDGIGLNIVAREPRLVTRILALDDGTITSRVAPRGRGGLRS